MKTFLFILITFLLTTTSIVHGQKRHPTPSPETTPIVTPEPTEPVTTTTPAVSPSPHPTGITPHPTQPVTVTPTTHPPHVTPTSIPLTIEPSPPEPPIIGKTDNTPSITPVPIVQAAASLPPVKALSKIFPTYISPALSLFPHILPKEFYQSYALPLSMTIELLLLAAVLFVIGIYLLFPYAITVIKNKFASTYKYKSNLYETV